MMCNIAVVVMLCMCLMPWSASRANAFWTASEEKGARAFHALRLFVDLLDMIGEYRDVNEDARYDADQKFRLAKQRKMTAFASHGYAG